MDVFERAVDADSAHAAVRRAGPGGADRVVSFGRLDEWANAIAAELLARRGGRSEPVPLAVCAPELMLAAALGVLKAGKFYAALNPAHPQPHVQRMLDELDAPLVLCDHAGAAMARLGPAVTCVEEILARRPAAERPGVRCRERRLAYVLYTSGSTGRPRGIAQTRRDMLHNVARHRPLAIDPGDCVTLISADGFVGAVSNVYIALLHGATLAPYAFRDAGVTGVLDWLIAAGVSVFYGFPSFLRQLVPAETGRAYGELRLAYLGGETVLPADLRAARRLFPAAALGVGLNSSETGLTCLHIVPPGAPIPDPVPVGRPALDVEVAVVDDRGAVLPPGARGRIEIRSEYVRPRYWRRGGVQADRPAPAFTTADLGRVDASGVVHHAGRADQMLKVRGYRVQAGEVEAAISRLAGVAEVAVFGLGEPAVTELAAAIVAVAGAAVDPVAVRGAVARELPPAMIPTRVLLVDALPRTVNGKLDRRRLADFARRADHGAPAARASANGSAVESGAQNGSAAGAQVTDAGMLRAVERRLADIWRSELDIRDLPPGADFFALGGTSLTAVAVIARVRRELNVPVPLAVLFQTPTVCALAAAVLELQGQSEPDHRCMTQEPIVQPARERDFPDVCSLVNHYIEHTSFNFRADPQTPAEWVRDWQATRERYPWLVARAAGALVGIAYAGPWKGRAAYDWCAEVTVYVASDARRTGVGSALYRRLLELLDRQGYRTEIAVIALPNEPSVTFHEACGFRHAGTLDAVGYKRGTWLDVGFWQRRRPPGEEPPAAVRAVAGG